MNIQDKQQRHHWPWTWVSASLLLVYLVFFHLCMESTYATCILLGVICWTSWVGICYWCRDVFLNPFEYWIHQLVGVDILLEGFSPLHHGFGFYICAASFWSVFVAYRALGACRIESDYAKKPEYADSWAGSA